MKILPFKIVLFFLNIIVILSIIAILVIGLIQRDELDDNVTYKYIDLLGRNWKKGLISDIKIVYNNTSCGADYDTFLVNSWPGTIGGCDCTMISDSGVRRRKCSISKNSNEKQCQSIPPLSDQQYTIWKNKRICLKRLANSYLDLTIVKNRENCPEGMKACGQIDSLNNLLCVLNQENCPINKINFLGNNSSINQDKFKYTVLSASEGTVLYTNENTQGIIPVEFIASDKPPCVDIRFSNYAAEPYLLENYGDGFNCPLHSDISNTVINGNFEYLDSESKLTLFKENDIYFDLSKLPLFDNSAYNYNTNLYFRAYIGFNTNCIKALNPSQKQSLLSDLQDVTMNFADLESLSYSIWIACIIYSVCCLFPFCCVCFYFFDKSKAFFFRNIIIMILNIIGNIVLFCFFSLIETCFKKLTFDTNYKIVSSNCTDSIYSDYFKSYNSRIQMAEKCCNAGLIIAIVNLVVEVLSIIIDILCLLIGDQENLMISDINPFEYIPKTPKNN